MATLVLPMLDVTVSGVVYTSRRDRRGRLGCEVHLVHGQGELLVGGEHSGLSFFVSDGQGQGLVDLQGRDMEISRLGLGSDLWLSELLHWTKKIDDFFGCPQDIEWAVTRQGELFILQSRPITTATDHGSPPEPAQITGLGGRVILSGGQTASPGRGSGPVFILETEAEAEIPAGAVLVTRTIPPSLARHLTRIAAVVAERGSYGSHFATVCRELGVPLLIGMAQAQQVLQPDQVVTVDGDAGLVYAGALSTSQERPAESREIPYFQRLHAALSFVTPLGLLDPDSKDFRPENCRSLHDIIRYTHEQAVRSMFVLGERGGGRCRRLRTSLPIAVNFLDVGGGIRTDRSEEKSLDLAEVSCRPFVCFWQGLTHPSVDWTSQSHFDWKTFDELALAGGCTIKKSDELASYAIVSDVYLNLNIRFGYHFTLLDALYGRDIRTTYCQLRFGGGGGVYTGRSLRLQLLTIILERLGFAVTSKADLLDARLQEVSSEELDRALVQVGRLMGMSKLLDMVLREERQVQEHVKRFFAIDDGE